MIQPTDPCQRCGHKADDHRLDDSRNISPADPNAEFRCLGVDWLKGCDQQCPDFVGADDTAKVGANA
jgi:hypothetical protein